MISKDEVITRINEVLKGLINARLDWTVKAQKSGVGTYDYAKKTVYIPINYSNEMKLTGIIHEAAHLLLRHELRNQIKPRVLDALKWEMNPFLINNSVFTLDETFACYITLKATRKLSPDLFEKSINLGRPVKPDYSGSDEKLHMLLAEHSSWKIPVMLKNSTMNILNALNNLKLVPEKERPMIIINSLRNIKARTYEDFVNNIFKDPLSDPFFNFANQIKQVKFNDGLVRNVDPQVWLDYLEVISWLGYIKVHTAREYNDFFMNFNTLNAEVKPQEDFIISKTVNEKLREARRRVENALDGKSKTIINEVNKFMKARLLYREKINYEFDYEDYGPGRIKKN